MFDITSSKLLLLAIVALLVIGPKDFPILLRTIGKYLGIIRGHAKEFRAQFDEMAREFGVVPAQEGRGEHRAGDGGLAERHRPVRREELRGCAPGRRGHAGARSVRARRQRSAGGSAAPATAEAAATGPNGASPAPETPPIPEASPAADTPAEPGPAVAAPAPAPAPEKTGA